MIWVITSPDAIPGEGIIIGELLQAGASRVLIRKPGWTMEQYIGLLAHIDPVCYPRIVIRDHALLAGVYGLAGVHWSGMQAAANKNTLITTRENSIGIHTISEITSTDIRYNTLLLSPVFDSISKPGYAGRHQAILVNNRRTVLALGGVDHTNIHLLKQWHFSGAALLGSIWRTPEKAVEHYSRMQQLWNKSDLM
ncbi:thiamine-phosphate pyrophosphorylase [Chitinophaga polysaccharea]|uniref:Thiamine-phosphate pyrophosphorylase n=1 Tax=Chitinophaga polysaccharea TaxID=1293035 RepID=A0A561Q365_9BACT|nr:thiamine phosphate synthase [Chitinophaga polysaccharea]TWF44818.1 thiamine-phosphate pyrophosphorylase [Chitinophaga polysaccharea]